MNSPYREPAVPGEDLEPDGGIDYNWDVEKITVRFKFKDEEITEVIEGRVEPSPCDGILRALPWCAPLYYRAPEVLDALLKKGCADGFLKLGDAIKPWHMFVRSDIINREEKRIAFRWIPKDMSEVLGAPKPGMLG